jgi:hypothetical protein
LSGVRPSPPSFSLREPAERAAATLCALSLDGGSLDERAHVN